MADTAQTTSGGVAQTVDGLINKGTGWVDKIFEFFGVYTAKYSKYIVYILLIVALGKVLKVKLNVGGGGKR